MGYKPLTGPEQGELKRAITSDNGNSKAGYLRGMTYARMAVEFGRRIGREVTPRQIRHYVNLFKNALDYQQPIGAPAGSRRSKWASQPNIFGALGNELRALTGLSASGLYDALCAAQDEQSPFGSRATFHSRLKHPSWPSSPKTIPKPRAHAIERAGLLYRCQLHLHAAHFELDPGKRYLLVLGGHEEVTGHIDFRFIEAHVENEEHQPSVKKQGRPINLNGSAEIAIAISPDGFRIELTANILSAFIADMIAPLHVPVMRIKLRRSLFITEGPDGLRETHLPKKIFIDDQPWHPYLPSGLSDVASPKKLAETIAQWVRRYTDNVTAKEVQKLRGTFNSALQEARTIRKKNWEKYTQHEKRLRELKESFPRATQAQSMITNPCKHIHLRAVIKKNTEPKPGASSQTA